LDPRIHVSLDQLRALQGPSRGLNFLPRQPASSTLNGRYASRLRGRGLNFEEMRTYLPGDDVRSIDWRATARTGTPHVRVFTEERDRPTLLVVDQRMTMFFGATRNMKSVTAAEAAAIIAFRVLEAGDRVGGLIFDDDRTVELVPKRSRRAANRFLETLVSANVGLHADRPSRARAGSLNHVLRTVARLAHHDHLIVILSDFDGIDDVTHRHLSTIARHNDLILGLVHDLSFSLRSGRQGSVLSDGDLRAEFDFTRAEIADLVENFAVGRLERIRDWQREINLSIVPLSAAEETLPQLRRALGAAPREPRVR